MKKLYILLALVATSSIWTSCTENTNTVNASNPDEANITATSMPQVNSNPKNNETNGEPIRTAPKTDAEVALEGGELLANVTLSLIERQRIKDSINNTNKEKMYAYQIGVKMKEKEAFKAYQNLINAGIPSIYVFKAGRKDYYIIKFEDKGENELNLSLGDFKNQLGENGTEGLKVINLIDFCSKRETVEKDNMSEDGIEIRCLKCN